MRLEAAKWRKSSHSADEGTDCVEVAFTSEVVGVRDSKDTTARLAFSPAAWRAFLARLTPRPAATGSCPSSVAWGRGTSAGPARRRATAPGPR
ncbi:DUF397 domain-containing protein [Actinosynnema sp. NPDC053489]|uniref:DUF397 domain-containing protein n=1 Tax=Actinosynnema sp. NPDC053489 TaxID=3363916 RepID=UPI0037C8474F